MERGQRKKGIHDSGRENVNHESVVAAHAVGLSLDHMDVVVVVHTVVCGPESFLALLLLSSLPSVHYPMPSFL